MEMILLLNGYPPKFISYHIDRFFTMHSALSVWTELDYKAYAQLHQQSLYRPTRREKEAEVMHDDSGPTLTGKRSEKKGHVIIHHTFESGPLLDFKSEYRRLWNKTYGFQGSRIGKDRLIIGTLNNRCLQSLFIHKKPPRQMLTRME